MGLALNTVFTFNDFHSNMTYPKRIVNLSIENEFLSGGPNFRYKKLVIVRRTKASGKTTGGRSLKEIFNFISKKAPDSIPSCINDKGKNASFSLEFVGNTKRSYG